jgi:hypothetical protein
VPCASVNHLGNKKMQSKVVGCTIFASVKKVRVVLKKSVRFLTYFTKPQRGTGESPVKTDGEKAVGETVKWKKGA